MSRLKTVAKMVENILRNYPVTRDDDRELIRYLYARYYGINYYMPFGKVITNTDLPSFESIRRTRQKLQADNEELRGSKRKEDARLEAQADYIEFAREGA